MFRRGHSLQLSTVREFVQRLLPTVLPLLGLCLAEIVSAAEEPALQAECRVRIATDPQDDMRQEPAMVSVGAPISGVTANYRRNAGGDWNIPEQVDVDDSVVRLLLMTPDGPLLIDLSVFVNGTGFRAAREGWIDSVLTDASTDTDQQPEAKSPDTTSSDTTSSDTASSDTASTAAEATSSVREWQSSDAITRLRQYASRPGIDLSRSEARWLLAQWSPGPAFLELQPGFAGDRARQAPLWVALDTNADGVLSPEEVATSDSRLQSLDLDEDEWIAERELTRKKTPLADSWRSSHLLTVLNEFTDWSQLARVLRQTIVRSDSVLCHEFLNVLQLQNLSQITADHAAETISLPSHITVQVRFGSDQPTNRIVRVLSDRQDALQFMVSDEIVSVSLPGCVIELSASQPSNGGSPAATQGQVAVGAVLDGSPLLRQADRDNDRRLSVREATAVRGILAQSDGNGDGAVHLQEVRVPIRLAITQGPLVHRILSRSVNAPTVQPADDHSSAPDWFRSMDRNRDAELTRAEFPGTQDQFAELDLDGNGRISVKEVATSER